MSEKANFSNIYKFYDLINSVITLGFDKSWRNKASNQITGTRVLDLGSGTGAAFQQLQNLEVTAIDPDEKMMQLNQFSNKVIGKKGFGYDPIFIPKGKEITFGQMSKIKKMRIDHRFLAYKELLKKVKI